MSRELSAMKRKMDLLFKRAAAYEKKHYCFRADRDVAAILSALRGPDSGDDVVKDAGTARVRYLIFGVWGDNFGSINQDGKLPVERGRNEHYRDHISMARESLECLGYGPKSK